MINLLRLGFDFLGQPGFLPDKIIPLFFQFMG